MMATNTAYYHPANSTPCMHTHAMHDRLTEKAVASLFLHYLYALCTSSQTIAATLLHNHSHSKFHLLISSSLVKLKKKKKKYVMILERRKCHRNTVLEY